MTEETLFAAALDRADPAARAAFLADACPDPAVRRRVEDLLAAHAAAGTFLADPASGDAPTRAMPPTDPNVTATLGGGPAADAAEALAFLQPPTRPGSLGRLAHYEVEQVVGSGGFGTVFKAFDERLHRVVAIKVLAPQLAASGSARARFQRESRSAAAVRDDHVVNVHAVSDDDAPVPYLVMEFVAGQTLQQKVEKAGPLPPKEVLRIGAQIAGGLAAAHRQGLIHRDIKPANILLENGVERVKVTDFGLARAADDASISQSGVVAGTPMFMSPEQARGDALDTRSDLFSLGSVLYVLCTGRPPFRADSTLAVLKRVIEDDPRPVRDVNPEVPRWLADVVAKLHAKSPADRFQTAKEVADLLASYLAELQQQGTVVARAGIAPPAKPTPARWRARVGTYGLMVLVVAAAFPLAGLVIGPVEYAVRYVFNHNRVVLQSASGLDMADVTTEDGQTAWPPLLMPEQPESLPAGRYRLIPHFLPGYGAAEWELTAQGAFSSRTAVLEGREPTITVGRGERVTVRAVTTNTPPPASPWVPLFNGRDLTGWKTHPDQPGEWRVDAGHLVSTRAAGYLFSEKGDWQDFHLRAEVHVGPGGNSGVFFRTPFRLDRFAGADAGVFAPAGWYESDLFWGPVARPGRIKDLGETAETLAEPNQWFTLEVIARGNRFITKVNGKVAVDVVDAKSTFARGHLALQAFTPGTAVRFRKIEVKELAPAPVAPPPAVALFTAEQAKAHQEAWATHLGLRPDHENAAGMTFRLIPPGEFGMGLTDAELAAFRAELDTLPNVGEFQRFAAKSSGPQHTARITRPFYLAARETTVAHFRRFLDATKHRPTGTIDWARYVTPGLEDKQPVVGVSWADADAFCKWLGTTDGRTYELPTEAQWEYAARAGGAGLWWFGNDAKQLIDHAAVEQRTPAPGPGGLKKANPFGLFDMHGNVDEWCRDWHVRDYYRQAPIDDPANLATPTEANTGRSARGGSWNAHGAYTRAGARTFDNPTTPALPKGFRVVLVIDPKAAPQAIGPLKELVAAREKARDDAKVRVEIGVESPAAVHAAEYALADARAQLAEAEGDRPAVVARLREMVVAAREYRRLVALRVGIGTDEPDVLTRADAQLAEARTRLARAGGAEPPQPPEAPPPREKS